VKYKIWDSETTIEAEIEAAVVAAEAVDIAAEEAAVDTVVAAEAATVVDPERCTTQLVQIAAQLAKFHLHQPQADQFTAMLVFLTTEKTVVTEVVEEGQADTAVEDHATLTGQVTLLQPEISQAVTQQMIQATTLMIQPKKQLSKSDCN